ncbi:uncharacterized protein LOC123303049 [Chrysoperla carnea]|uniref:uncharacterized protein LOC123303049 n=1 Tax=Chrysoperla carnea TaxID=189513 RepID=UPI001D0976CE|nr:uncharacterized protein LOC123303049 [Chrysoperla carnea]
MRVRQTSCVGRLVRQPVTCRSGMNLHEHHHGKHVKSSSKIEFFLLSNFRRIDNTDHIIDVNKGNVQFEYDQVNIICPTYMPGAYDGDPEKYIIYNVSKEEYETCRITDLNPRIIAICDKPFKTMYFTITFRPFTPQPGGLEFLPGNDYYFISTSSKGDLHRRIGGRCSTHNMKVVFKVCCAPEVTSEKPSTAVSDARVPTVGTALTKIAWPEWQTPGPTSPAHTYTAPTTPKSTQSRPSRKQLNKKTNEHNKHENEVVKNEELTYNRGSSSMKQKSVSLILPFYITMSIFYVVRERFR